MSAVVCLCVLWGAGGVDGDDDDDDGDGAGFGSNMTTTNTITGKDGSAEKHPEKRMKAAYKAYGTSRVYAIGRF